MRLEIITETDTIRKTVETKQAARRLVFLLLSMGERIICAELVHDGEVVAFYEKGQWI